MTEPNDEQKQAAHDEYEDAHGCIDAERVARLDASREYEQADDVKGGG